MTSFKSIIVASLFCILPFATVRAQAVILLKLDDLASKNSMSSAAPVLDVLVARKVKASIGVIASRLDSTAGTAYKKYIRATDEKGGKLFEIWNHGYDHSSTNGPDKNPEFKGTGYAFQKEHFDKADQRVKQLLGIDMHTFGAPFNASDSTFNKVIGEHSKYKAVFFSSIKPVGVKGLMNLDNRVNMESATGMVNFEYFLTQYENFKGQYHDYMVLQGHPNQWDAAKLAEFNKIIDFLIAQHHQFGLPYAYSQMKK